MTKPDPRCPLSRLVCVGVAFDGEIETLISIARIYAGLGKSELVFRWLQKAYEDHSDHLLALGVDRRSIASGPIPDLQI